MKKLFFSLILFFGLFFWVSSFTFAKDLLEQGFEMAVNDNSIIGWRGRIWTTKKEVGEFLLRDSLKVDAGKTVGGVINIVTGKWSEKLKESVSKKPSFIVSFTKFLLRFTIGIAVTMIIYNGVLYVIKATKGENPKEVLNNILYIFLWLILALSCVIIIRLVSSVGKSSLWWI